MVWRGGDRDHMQVTAITKSARVIKPMILAAHANPKARLKLSKGDRIDDTANGVS